MSPTEKLLSELGENFVDMREEQARIRADVGDLGGAIANLVQVMRQLMEARRSDREILIKILEACTREGGGEIADAIKHIGATIIVMGGDVKAILGAVRPTDPAA